MPIVSNARAVSLAAVIAFSAVGVARGQFYLTGNAPGTHGSRVYGLSADGRVATGFSEDQNNPSVGFTWTASGGRTDYLPQSGFSVYNSFAISGDGTTIVGAGVDAAGHGRPMRYTGSGAYQNLGTIGNYPEGAAYGVSGNGSVVAGDVFDSLSGFGLSFRWTQATGIRRLGGTRAEHYNSHAYGVSRDGLTIVGSSNDASTQDGFVWTEATGMRALHGVGGTDAQALAVNNIGNIVVGSFRMPNSSQSHAAMWRDGLTLDLGLTSEMRSAYAYGVSDDGSVVVGKATMSDFFSNRACVWTPGTGMILLETYLVSNGVSMPTDWVFTQCTSVSADGRTFAGLGHFPSDSLPRGFVVTVPAPGAMSFAMVGTAAISIRRRRFLA